MRSSNERLKLFVGDLGDNRKSDLNHLFSKYGEISTIYFDENKRFAFVEFTSSTDAERALEHTNNKIVNGAKLRVEYAKSDKTSRRPLSRDHSPTSILYSHLQVTANRLPPMQVFRQNYHQYYPPTMISNSTSLSRGRSLTPPSFKQNSRLPSMHHLRTQDFYYQQPAIYSDPAYYRTYGGDPYLMQRLPPPAFLPSTSPPLSRAYRNMYSSSGIDRYMTTVSYHRRSRSRSRRRYENK
jgi:RNA recognition motif-containing protein